MNLTDKITRNPEKILAFFESLRKALIRTGIAVLAFSVCGYYVSEPILKYVQRSTGVKLVAFGIPETFFALLLLAVGFGIFVSIPYILYTLLDGLPPLFPTFTRKIMIGFWLSSIVLFYSGTVFCLFISLPYGAQFLLSYENAQLEALISVQKFVSFCLMFLFGFGIVFELPLAMVLLGKIGLVKAQTLAAHRRYAILAVAVVAAILTPTPDAFNMALMGLPLYVLFEIGLIGMRFVK
ncbi:MAG: twin-arginine translocase subunit TatC [Thermodesulfobacteriota bacterium]